MVYTWGYDEFVNQAKKLQELIATENDLKKRLYLEKVADVTDKLFNRLFNNSPVPNVTKKQSLANILDSRLEYGRYYSIVSGFFNECVNHLELIDKISGELEKIDENGQFYFLQTGVTINHEQTLSLVYKFYSEFDNELFDYFLSVYNDRKDTLRFLKKKDNDEIKETDGNTCFIDGVRKNFITIYDTTPLETFACTVHEYGHAIQNLINPETSYEECNDFFLEVASIFPELVAIYENKDNFSQLEKDYALYTTCVTYINFAEFITLHTPLINEWAAHSYIMSKDFFKTIEENYNIDKECFDNTILTTIEEEGVYVISFIVALELFHIYKRDKKKALELFKGFLKYPANQDVLVYVKENFELNKHVSEEIENVLNDFGKKLERRN